MKGYKNRNHTEKHVISEAKFSRLFSQNLNCAGVCTLYRGHDEGFINSVQALEINGFVYARFPCRNPEGNRLKTFAIRYSLENPLDFVSFSKYSSNVFAPVEF